MVQATVITIINYDRKTFMLQGTCVKVRKKFVISGKIRWCFGPWHVLVFFTVKAGVYLSAAPQYGAQMVGLGDLSEKNLP